MCVGSAHSSLSRPRVGCRSIPQATYNVSTGAKVFINGALEGHTTTSRTHSQHHPLAADHIAQAEPRGSDILFGASAAGGGAGVLADGLFGAVEEAYLKNVSAEERVAYMFADDNRPQGLAPPPTHHHPSSTTRRGVMARPVRGEGGGGAGRRSQVELTLLFIMRAIGTYLLDLTRQEGRNYFNYTVASILTSASFEATQWDGFEKLFLISGTGTQPQ